MATQRARRIASASSASVVQQVYGLITGAAVTRNIGEVLKIAPVLRALEGDFAVTDIAWILDNLNVGCKFVFGGHISSVTN